MKRIKKCIIAHNIGLYIIGLYYQYDQILNYAILFNTFKKTETFKWIRLQLLERLVYFQKLRHQRHIGKIWWPIKIHECLHKQSKWDVILMIILHRLKGLKINTIVPQGAILMVSSLILRAMHWMQHSSKGWTIPFNGHCRSLVRH